MRILNLIPSLSGGGAERQLGYLALHLAKKGHEVHIGYLYDGPQPVSFEPVTLYRVSANGNYDPGLLAGILRLIRSVRPDIVQTWVLQMDILGGIASNLARVPWVLREASCGFTGRQPSDKCRALMKEFFRVCIASTAGGIIANSRGGLAYWDKLYSGRIKLIIPNGFPYDSISSVPSGPIHGGPVPADTKIVLTVGRFDTVKRFFSRLLDVIPMFRGTDVHFVILGGGPTLDQTVRKVSALGLTKYVTFLGQVSPEVVIQWMRRADLFCFMSAFEGFPNVLAEAVLCNCPVVLSDIPAHRELLDENGAFFVNHRCPEEVAKGINTMLESPEMANEMARRSFCRMKEFTVPEMARKYVDAYVRILGRA